MSTKKRRTLAEVKEAMKHSANRSRDVADEMALWSGGCDDPHHPWGPQVFTDWHDFTERVCRPLVEADGDEVVVQKAMALYRKQSPYGICVSLFFALNTIHRLEAEVARLRTFLPPIDEASVDL